MGVKLSVRVCIFPILILRNATGHSYISIMNSLNIFFSSNILGRLSYGYIQPLELLIIPWYANLGKLETSTKPKTLSFCLMKIHVHSLMKILKPRWVEYFTIAYCILIIYQLVSVLESSFRNIPDLGCKHILRICIVLLS